MPCQSVPHMLKALSCALLKRVISVTKERNKKQRLNACRLAEVLHFKEEGCAKKQVLSRVCCLSVL